MLELSIINLDSVDLKLEKKFNDNGIYTIKDLLNTFPKKSIENNISDELKINEKITVEVLINSQVKGSYTSRGLHKTTFKVLYKNFEYDCIIFNRKNLYKLISQGKTVFITGKLDQFKQFVLTEVKLVHEDMETTYRIKNIKDYLIKACVKEALEKCQTMFIETLPTKYIEKYKLISKHDFYFYGHSPKNINEYKQFQRRSKYEELLLFELKLEYKKYLIKTKQKSIKISENINDLSDMINKLPYKLTTEQVTALNEILFDLRQDYPLNRLLEGDVGSGKTIVSFLSAFTVMKEGYQVAMMAPTEILAKQHFDNFNSLFGDLRSEILLGSTKPKDRNEILKKLSNGEIDILFGTHALFSDDVIYKNLALVITDEQHRFGVNQRKKLENKGSHMNVLHLSATPIPRSLAITLFGDMDLSIIKELPKSRIPIKTRLMSKNQIKSVHRFIEELLSRKEQIYIITPLIEESETMDLENAKKVYEDYKTIYGDQVGLLHGKLSTLEKEQVYSDFINGNINILISTTVVEVGVDNKNATLIVILDPERFGLSQLHQLRGRVGRSNLQSYCILLTNTNQLDSIERLRIIESTNSGFEIANKDLEIRGPGEIFGSKQSGEIKFKFSSLINDKNILEVAKLDAQEIIRDIDNVSYNKIINEILKDIK